MTPRTTIWRISHTTTRPNRGRITESRFGQWTHQRRGRIKASNPFWAEDAPDKSVLGKGRTRETLTEQRMHQRLRFEQRTHQRKPIWAKDASVNPVLGSERINAEDASTHQIYFGLRTNMRNPIWAEDKSEKPVFRWGRIYVECETH
jgi:hypothetical protein